MLNDSGIFPTLGETLGAMVRFWPLKVTRERSMMSLIATCAVAKSRTRQVRTAFLVVFASRSPTRQVTVYFPGLIANEY